MVLNLKQVPFETVWIQLPEIEAKAKENGATPTRVDAEGTPIYTIPFVTIESPDGSKRTITDSMNIVRFFDEVDKDDPSRTLFPKDTRVLEGVCTTWIYENISRKFFPIILTACQRAMLPEYRQHFANVRTRIFNRPFESIAAMTPERLEEAWKGVEEALTRFANILDESSGKGSYRITPRATFAEITFASLLRVYKAYAYDDPNGWPRLAKLNGGRWARLTEEPEYDILESKYLK